MRLFGTDGLRGRAGEFPLDPESLSRIGLELGRRVLAAGRPPVVLGGDTRESTRAMIGQLAAGLSQSGCGVASAGVMTTPGIAELVLACGAGAGVSVSASHNPYEDNGVKIFGPDGRKWPDSEEQSLEDLLLASRDTLRDAPPSGGASTEPAPDPKLTTLYLDRLAAYMPADLSGLAIVVDAGNGAAFDLAPRALVRAGARVMPMSVEPDGRNINHGCGALHPEEMARRTRQSGAAMGVALDGDADRSIFGDETGRILDGDDVLWIVAREWKARGRLAAGGVVGTVMSNFGLEAALAHEGIAFHRAAVGDRNVARLMEEKGATIGGETSGHILLSLSPAGDGILTCLTIGRILSEKGGKLSELATLEKVPQSLRNVRAARRVPLEQVPAIQEAARRAEKALAGRGRVYLRYSGTEPLLRILVEGIDERDVLALAEELEAVAKRELPH
ncbi:MAG TPA: phosphoglucosamine mutase [Thermoanaerobaculia bacterium]|nr:phosphoglucosamine mutase [Thermoanaerobaculia bacterium]